jgi:CobQ-like glutamine amidotransferase family enzyme
VIGTYPHGPILARNPALADHVLELALGHEVPPLARPEIDKLRRQRLARVRRSSARRRARSRVQTEQLGPGSR